MRHSLAVHAVRLSVMASLCAGCHHSAPQTAATPSASMEEGHCWWAAYRTPTPPDSVAMRYAQAFTTLGLTGAGWSRQADTAWAQAEPTALTRPAGAGTYAMRVVAYRRGDTTFFRPFSAVRGDASANIGAMSIGFCGDASRASTVPATAPPDEEHDDSLPIWRRRPTR